MATMKHEVVYLTLEEFERGLDDFLTILKEPNGYNRKCYVCEYITPALYKKIVHVYVEK